MSERVVLTLNVGSTTLKAARFEGDATTLEPGGVEHRTVTSPDELPAALDEVVGVLLPDGVAPDVVGHRFVHGGPDLQEHVVVHERVLGQLERAARYAPLHVPPALRVLGTARSRWPDVPQVACLDTAFFVGLPEVDRRLPIPADLHRQGVRRYGFHGLSYEFVTGHVAAERAASGGLPPRTVVAHLGGGASLTALLEGRPVHTTMGLTPTGGLVMGTRTGDLDPGVVLHLLRAERLSPDEVEQIVEHEGGLLALSGGPEQGTSDEAELERRRPGDPDAAFAIEAFVRSVAMAVAASTAVLGGLDLLVFTGGIGEHSSEVRSEVQARLAHLAPFEVQVVPTDEEQVIARHALELAYRP
jgi:acetate kinase